MNCEKNFALDELGFVLLNKNNAEIALNNINYKTKDRIYYEKTGKSIADYTVDELSTIIRFISTVNHTRTPRETFQIFAEYIYQNMESFYRKLKDGDITLIDDLLNVKTKRKEKSLVSKICAYLCEYEFNEFHFIIIDSIICKVLPYYLNKYNVDASIPKNLEKSSYKEIYYLLSSLKNSLPENLSLYEIDQTLWYFFSNNNNKLTIAEKYNV